MDPRVKLDLFYYFPLYSTHVGVAVSRRSRKVRVVSIYSMYNRYLPVSCGPHDEAVLFCTSSLS